MRVKLAAAVAAFGVTLVAGQAMASIATPVSGTIFVQADANSGGNSATDSISDSWTTFPNSLGALGANAAAVSPNSGGVTAFGTMYATWYSADSGFLQGQDFGWNFKQDPNDQGGGANVNNGGPNWTYSFTLSSDATFNFNYNVYHFADPFGLQGWNLFVDNNQVTNLWNAYNPDASGSVAVNLGSGAHIVDIRNNANLSTASNLSNLQGYLEGDFNWDISPGASSGAPEPGAWAMMLLGFGGLGAVMRKQRRMAIAA